MPVVLQDAAIALTADATVDPAYRLRHVGLGGTLTCLILVYHERGLSATHTIMSGVPAFQWESDLSASVGLTTSEFRFAVSFFLSVFVSWCWRFVPTAQGTGQSTVGSFEP